MNSTLRSILAFLTLFVFIATSVLHAATDAPVLSRIQKSGKLVLGTSGNMPLMSEKQANGELTGLDIDLATAMAESMGVKLDIKTIAFAELIPALEQGKVDVHAGSPELRRNAVRRFPWFGSGPARRPAR